MKQFYKINEISKLYNIGPDSLRYYEKIGAIHPKRGENGYRYYSLQDIYRLNIIRDLLQLGFSMERIKQYLDHQNVEQTMWLLQEELEEIQAQLARLREMETSIQRRMNGIREFHNRKTGGFEIKTFPERPCIRLDEGVIRDEEVDFLIKKLHQKYAEKIRDFCNYTRGACLSLSDCRKGVYNRYHGVFFILDEGIGGEFYLPGGQYLTCSYFGDYSQSAERIPHMLEYAENQNIPLSEDVLELYLMDNHYTTKSEEFLTEIQIPIL